MFFHKLPIHDLFWCVRVGLVSDVGHLVGITGITIFSSAHLSRKRKRQACTIIC
jgi:hypothetical protein